MYERFNVLYGSRQDAECDIQLTRVSSIRVLGGLRYALCSERIAQTATCWIHIVWKDIPSCHLGRYLVASQVSSKRCSCMPLIRLVRLRWALEGETPSFDPIYPTEWQGRWATRKRHRAGNGMMTCYLVKVGNQADSGGVS